MSEPQFYEEPALPYEIVCSATDNEEEWLERRREGIGASEIAILMGASEWGSNVGLYFMKTGEVEVDPFVPTEHTESGKLIEPVIVSEIARRAGVSLLTCGMLLRNKEYPFIMATPDALTADGEPIEAKNISFGFDEEEWAEAIPEKYFLQCQQQMLVTGAKRCLFGALLWGYRWVWEWVPRNETVIRSIIATSKTFWGYVERREVPPSDGHNQAKKLLERNAKSPESVEVYEGDLVGELAEYFRAKDAHDRARQAAKTAERNYNAARDRVAQKLGQHREAHTSTGLTLRWKRTEKKGHVVKPSTIIKFEIKEAKRN